VARQKADLVSAKRDYDRWRKTQSSEIYSVVRKLGSEKLDKQQKIYRERREELEKDIFRGLKYLARCPDFAKIEQEDSERLVRLAFSARAETDKLAAEIKNKYFPPEKKNDESQAMKEEFEALDPEVKQLAYDVADIADLAEEEWADLPNLGGILQLYRDWDRKPHMHPEVQEFEDSLESMRKHLNQLTTSVDQLAYNAGTVMTQGTNVFDRRTEAASQKKDLTKLKTQV
jgi:hypothetical protein